MNTYCFLNTFYVFSNSDEDALEKFRKFYKEYFKAAFSAPDKSRKLGDIYINIRDLMKFEAFNKNEELKTGPDNYLFVTKIRSDQDNDIFLSFNKCLYGYDVYSFIINVVSTAYVHQKVQTYCIPSLSGDMLSHSKIQKEINEVI